MWQLPQMTVEEILLYLRKSRTDDPALTVEEVLAKHETLLDEWVERHFPGQRVPEENRYREVVSGETIEDRPQVQEVLRKMESPKYKAVLVVEPQRLSRGDLEDVGRLMKLLRYTNTIVATTSEIYDLREERDRDLFERELKRGNEFLEYQKKIMKRGRELAVSQGHYLGKKPPYGFQKTIVMDGKRKCHTLEPHPEQADVVRMIFDMYVNQDLGRVTLARKLNELGIKSATGGQWSQDTIKTMLENDHYIGKVRWNWKQTITIVEGGEIRKVRPRSKVGEYLIYDGLHEGLVSEELFLAAREKKGRNHRAKPKTKVRNPLAGLLFCQCGRAMSLRTYKNKGVERAAPRLLCDNQAYCGTSSALYQDIINRVREMLVQQIEDFEIRIENDDKDSRSLHESLIKQLEQQLAELEKKELSQWEKYSEEDMPKEIFEKLNAKVLQDKAAVQQGLCTARKSMPAPVDYEEKLVRFQEALAALDDPEADAERKNNLLKACIERIDYHREKAERIPSQQVRVYDPDVKKTVSRSPLNTGGNWTNPEIRLDFTLRA